MVYYSSPKENREAKTPSWKKEMPQLLWTEGGEEDVQQWVIEEQQRDWDFKKHECCLVMDRKRRMQWEVTQNKNIKLTVARKIHYRVSRMWKLNMTHSWEGGQGWLYPDLQLDYVSKKLNISFLDLVTSISVVHCGFSGFLQANMYQCVYSCSEKNYRSWQNPYAFLLPLKVRMSSIFHIFLKFRHYAIQLFIQSGKCLRD